MQVLADQVLVSGASFLTNILVARSIGISEYGVFSTIILIQLFLLSIQQAASSGLFQVLWGRFEGAQKINYTNGLFYAQCFLYFLLLCVCLCIYILNPSLLVTYNKIISPAILATFLFLLQDFLRKIFLSSEKEHRALLIDFVTNFLQICLLAYYALLQKLDLPAACWIVAITYIPSVILGIYWLRPGPIIFRNIRFAWKNHKEQSGWMFLSAIVQWLAGNFFVLAAGWWLGAAALGALRLAQYIFGLLNVVLQAVENYVLPKASLIQHSDIQFRKFLLTVWKKTILIFIPAITLLVLFSEVIMKLAGGQSYTGYSYVIYGLSVVYVVIITSLPIRIALRVKLLGQNYFIGYVLSAIFSILTAKWLLLNWQLYGVLVGLLITQLIVVVYWILILKSKNILLWKLSI